MLFAFAGELQLLEPGDLHDQAATGPIPVKGCGGICGGGIDGSGMRGGGGADGHRAIRTGVSMAVTL